MWVWIVEFYLYARECVTPDKEQELEFMHDSDIVSASEPHSWGLHELITPQSQPKLVIYKMPMEDIANVDMPKVE